MGEHNALGPGLLSVTQIIIPSFKEQPWSWQAEVERNIRTGIGKEKVMQKEAMARIARAEQALGPTKSIDGVGRKIASIPARMWHRWQREERGCWEDKGFLKDMLRDNPELRVK